MRYFERSGQRESVDAAIAAAARAYGFTAPPLVIPKKDASDAGSGTALVAKLISKIGAVTSTTQAWAVARARGGTAIVFAIAAPKHAIAQAFVIKSALATAESAGFTNLTVMISSVGDNDSRRRYTHELGNFFRRHAKELTDELKELGAKDPQAAMRSLIESGSPLADILPKTIDYLSEPSRRVMLETIALLESLGIRYELAPRLPVEPLISRELVFAIDGTDPKGTRMRIASGGRVGDPKTGSPVSVGIAVALPDTLTVKSHDTAPISCYVVHVGEAAKIKAFGLLESLWRSRIALGQALLVDTVQEQMRRAAESGARYLAIIGQREALDETVIVRTVATQLQETIPLDRVPSRLARARA